MTTDRAVTHLIARARRGFEAGSTFTPTRVLILVGVCLIFGGEAFCLVGPIRYERLVHVTCHATFYVGVMLVCLGAILHYVVRHAP